MATWIQLIGSGLLVVSLMFAAGLQLRVADILALRRQPRLLALALFVNLVVLPGITWLLLAGLALPPEVVLGLMLCMAAPGGPAAVLYVNTARANLPLTVSLTIALPIIGVITTPLTLSLVPDLPADLTIPAGPVILSLVGFQLLPLAIGMLINARKPELAARMTKPAKLTANLTLGSLVLVMMLLKGDILLGITGAAWIAMIGAAAASLVLGYLAALPDRSSAEAGSIVAISRNISVAIMLASTFFIDPLIDATVLTFGLVAFLAPLALALIWRRKRPGS